MWCSHWKVEAASASADSRKLLSTFLNYFWHPSAVTSAFLLISNDSKTACPHRLTTRTYTGPGTRCTRARRRRACACCWPPTTPALAGALRQPSRAAHAVRTQQPHASMQEALQRLSLRAAPHRKALLSRRARRVAAAPLQGLGTTRWEPAAAAHCERGAAMVAAAA